MKKILLLTLLPFLLFAQPPCVPTLININLDQYPSETTWDIIDSYGNTVLSGGPYDSVPNYQPQMIWNCLPTGVLYFTIYDQYGDGLQGSLWGGNDGSYYVIQCGDTLVYGDVPNFGTDSTHMLMSDTCIPPPPIPGCMDENYLEFDPAATVSDSSCATLKILGCMDSTMFNYDSTANSLDYVTSCNYTLILKDLIGNGWVGSYLEIRQADTAYQFVMDSLGPNQFFNITLDAPETFEVEFFVVQQANGTTIECGFEIINPLGVVIMDVPPTTLNAFVAYPGFSFCGDGCIPFINGCLDSIAFNYDQQANTSDTSCYYNPGCTSPAYLAFHVDTAMGIYRDYLNQDSCLVGGLAVFGCTDFLAFNYNPLANVNVGCTPVITGCMQALAFNYNANANTPDTCIAVVYGCMSSIAFNYDSLANTDDGSCTEFIYGCMDSTMFNFNPLANSDDNTCIPFIYGCTDPSMLNYSTSANTEDFSCIAYIYGCMDSLAINFDPLANTNNNSCIESVVGCMDQSAYNYEPAANVNDSLYCLYDANCIGSPGNPYWLNDPCYAWVIDVDSYCCGNAWDNVCQATYDYCAGTWVGPMPFRTSSKELISITDMLGRPANKNQRGVLFYRYNDNTIERIIKK